MAGRRRTIRLWGQPCSFQGCWDMLHWGKCCVRVETGRKTRHTLERRRPTLRGNRVDRSGMPRETHPPGSSPRGTFYCSLSLPSLRAPAGVPDPWSPPRVQQEAGQKNGRALRAAAGALEKGRIRWVARWVAHGLGAFDCTARMTRTIRGVSP